MSEKRKWSFGRIVRGLIWTALLIAAFGFVSLWILSVIGGKSDPLREGLEQFFAQATGGYAHIAELNNLSLYPLVEIDFSGLTIGNNAESEPIMTLGRGVVSMRFWDVFLSRDLLVGLAVDNLWIAPGELGPGALAIAKGAIVHDEGTPPRFVIEGAYNDRPLNASFPLVARNNRAYGHLYAVDEDGADFRISIGDLFLAGEHSALSFFTGGYKLEKLEAGLGDRTILSGDLNIRRNRHSTHVEGTLKADKSEFVPNVRFGEKAAPGKVSGTLRVPVLLLGDLGGEAGLGAFVAAVSETFFAEREEAPRTPVSESFEGQSIDLSVNVEKIMAGDEHFGEVRVPIRLQNKILNVEPGGTISGGDLSGRVVLNAAVPPAKLEADLSLSGLEIGQIQKGLAGTGHVSSRSDIRARLEGSGETWSAILKSLHGEAAFIAGEGKLASNMLSVWGGGVLNAMLPSLDPGQGLSMNCAIADFRVEKGIASAQALLLDTSEVLVQGEGTVDLPANRIDLKFAPESKGVAIGDIAVPVVVTGPIGNPSVAPSALGLGAKLGGLLLGTVNPAFLAFSLTDLGLTEDHPCYAYIEKGDPAPRQEATEAP